jgi:hypothetical protein
LSRAVQISRIALLNSGIPTADMWFRTFQLSLLCELIFGLALAGHTEDGVSA